MGCRDKTCQLLPSGEITVLNKLSTCIMKIPNIPHSSHHWLGMDPGPKKLHQKSFVSLWQDLSKHNNLRNTRRMVRSFSLHDCPAEIPNDSRPGKRSRFPDYQSKSSVTWKPASDWVKSAQLTSEVTSCHCPPMFISWRDLSTFWKGVLIPLTQKSRKRESNISAISRNYMSEDVMGLGFTFTSFTRTGQESPACSWGRRRSE